MTLIHVARLPPDISYFLDCSVACLHITGDTYHYFTNLAGSQATQIIDGYEENERQFERHWHRLIDMGLHLEDRFLRWRCRADPEAIAEVSLLGLGGIELQMREFVGTYANELADRGHAALTPEALRDADRKFGFATNTEVMARAVRRIAADLSGATRSDLLAIRQRLRQRAEDQRRADAEFVEQHRRGLVVAEPDRDYRDREAEIEQVRADLRRAEEAKQKEERKIVKRSIKLAQKLLGHDTTRLFIGRHKIRFEGRHAVYEMTRTGSMTGSHGSSRLSVFDKENDVHLCDLCIYTPTVPVLDHVASIALHIRTGNEADILTIGNAFNISEQGKRTPWLQPFLPQLRPDGVGSLRAAARDAGWQRRNDHLRRLLHRRWFEIVEPVVPTMRTMRGIEG